MYHAYVCGGLWVFHLPQWERLSHLQSGGNSSLAHAEVIEILAGAERVVQYSLAFNTPVTG
jgi:hypothetical protein